MSNLKQTTNKIRIEGILAESNIDYRNYTKNGEEIRAIGGEFQVLVRTVVDGFPKDLMIPVRVFSNELTKKGTKNPAFVSIEKVKNFVAGLEIIAGRKKQRDVASSWYALQLLNCFSKNFVAGLEIIAGRKKFFPV